MFQAIHLVRINGEVQVSNLTKERQEILKYLGRVCGQYYLITEIISIWQSRDVPAFSRVETFRRNVSTRFLNSVN